MDFDEIDPQLARFINATDTTKGLDMLLKIGGDLSETVLLHKIALGEYDFVAKIVPALKNARSVPRLLGVPRELCSISRIMFSKTMDQNEKLLRLVAHSCSGLFWYADNLNYLTRHGIISRDIGANVQRGMQMMQIAVGIGLYFRLCSIRRLMLEMTDESKSAADIRAIKFELFAACMRFLGDAVIFVQLSHANNLFVKLTPEASNALDLVFDATYFLSDY